MGYINGHYVCDRCGSVCGGIGTSKGWSCGNSSAICPTCLNIERQAKALEKQNKLLEKQTRAMERSSRAESKGPSLALRIIDKISERAERRRESRELSITLPRSKSKLKGVILIFENDEYENYVDMYGSTYESDYEEFDNLGEYSREEFSSFINPSEE